jgi:hypothetical protein
MSEPATKADLDNAVVELRAEMKELRVEWRQEMLAQVRWYATIILVQFLAVIAAVGFLDRLRS